MVSELGVISKILFKVLELFDFKYIPNKIKIKKYVEEVLAHITIIIETENFPSEKANHSHEVIKKLYKNASIDIGNIVSSNDFDKIMQGLSAARIYYWIRHFKEDPSEDIISLIDNRIKRIRQGSVRHHSLEYIVKTIKELRKTDTDFEEIIEAIYENTHADMAELKRVSLKIAIT